MQFVVTDKVWWSTGYHRLNTYMCLYLKTERKFRIILIVIIVLVTPTRHPSFLLEIRGLFLQLRKFSSPNLFFSLSSCSFSLLIVLYFVPTLVFALNICSSKFLRSNWQNFSLIEAAEIYDYKIFLEFFFFFVLNYARLSQHILCLCILGSDCECSGEKISAVVWNFHSLRCVRKKCDLLTRNKSWKKVASHVHTSRCHTIKSFLQ